MTEVLVETLPKISVQDIEWKEKSADERKSLYYSQQLGINEIVAKLLSNRNSSNDPEKFIRPTIRSLMSDPMRLKGMKAAVSRVVQTYIAMDKICIFGDYDVDGATSTALLVKFFKEIGLSTTFYIPDRILEGYGPNIEAFDKIKADGCNLVITVDCGTQSFKALEHAKAIGLDVIVIDHHLSLSTLPPAVAIINPNRFDEDSEYTNLAAVGVTFLFLVALSSGLRSDMFACDPPELLQYLDLVALGTVCDVVPLTGINRAFVSQGLKVIKQRANLGIRTLIDIAGVNETPSAYHLGFVIGPRINAGGRVGKSDLGARILTSDNIDEVKALAEQLNNFNTERKQIENKMIDEANEAAENGNKEGIIFVSSDQWHQGVIGIVAGRLKDKFHLPTAVISIEGDIAKASCRSIEPIDFGSLVAKAKQKGILLEGGGHKMAAGFSAKRELLPEVEEFFRHEILTNHREDLGKITKYYDAEINISYVNNEFISSLEILEPFGQGNPAPRFLLKDVVLSTPSTYCDKHIYAIVYVLKIHKFVRAKAFRVVGTKLGDAIFRYDNYIVDVVCTLKSNLCYGQLRAEIVIEDVILTPNSKHIYEHLGYK